MSFERDEFAETEEGRDARGLLRRCAAFQDLDDRLLDALAGEVEWFALPGGTTLFEAGDAADALYLVVNGALGAYASAAEGPRRLMGRITAGETVGEMALISGRPRSATVVALRDTELGRLSRTAFEALMLSHPQALLRISQLTVQRLESAQKQARAQRAVPKTIAVVPTEGQGAAAVFAAKLLTQLERIGKTELVWSQRGADHTSQWFHEIERDNEFVVYVCDALPTAWSKLCLRQADSLLLVANVDAKPEDWPLLQALSPRQSSSLRTEVVLLHRDRIIPGSARPWLEQHSALPHHHVRNSADVARLVRLLTGRGLGVVLSGGGARGLAHIGVLRAIREAGLVVDAIGGTSIGAIVAAGFAAEWSDAELAARVHQCFVATNPLNDYTLPLVSLVSGRKVSRLLKHEFGDGMIEDLPLPFFCVSSNLSTGHLAVHRRGELWRWLRASVAIPGVLPPVIFNGEVFVDGATINNLPVDVMRDYGLGRVIGVDVGADPVFTTDSVDSDAPPLWRIVQWFRGRKRRINILQILWRAGMINSAANTVARRELSTLLLQPPLEQIDMLNWQAFDRAVDAGYRYAKQRLEAWQMEQGGGGGLEAE